MSIMAHLETPAREAFSRISELAPGGFSAGIRLRFGRPAVLVATYSPEWTQTYDEMNAGLADPVIVWGLVNTGVRRWSQIKVPDPFGIFDKAAEHGLRYGATASVGPLNSKSISSMGRGDREFTDEEISKFHSEIKFLHEIIGQRRPLIDDHIRVLEAYAQGMSYEEICARFDISKTVLKHRLSGARKRLGAASNLEAVRIATEKNLLRAHSMTGNRL